MLSINPQYIVDDNQVKQAVVIQIKPWEDIVEKLEMLDDIEAYDKARKNKSEVISFDDAVKNIHRKQGKLI